MASSDANRQKSSDPDFLLAERAAGGDSTAFDQLVGEHRAALHRFVELRIEAKLRTRVDASDVVQETLVRAYRQLPGYVERRPMPFRLWLLKTAVDLTRDLRIKHLKRLRRSLEREVAWPNQSSMLLAQNLSRQKSPSALAIQKEQLQAVAALICGMRERDREVLVLRHIEDLKFEEIGSILELTTVTARKRYARALLRLQELCSEHGISKV